MNKLYNPSSKRLILFLSISIIFSIVFSAPAADKVGIKTNFTGGSWWPSLNIELTNTGSTAINTWELEFDFPHSITYFGNAQIKTNNSGHYLLGNNPWGNALSPGQTITISGGFSGGAQMPPDTELPTSFTFNGSAVGEENSSPEVNITMPTNGSVIEQEALSPVNISAAASDSDGTVENVSINVDGQTFNEATASWTPSDFGTYTINATATDNEGAASTATSSVTIKEKTVVVNIPPQVNITTPTNGSIIEQESLSPVNIAVSASDSDGTVENVTINVDGQIFNGATASWTPSDFGTYAINATATDNEGKTATTVITLQIKEKIASSSTVKGWPNYIAMGAVTRGIESHHDGKPVDAVFKYAGDGGNGDRGSIKYPIYTKNIGPMVKSLSSKYGKNVTPVMVVYTAEMSGGTNFEDLHDFDNLTKHFINLMHTAKILQSFKSTENPYPGSIVLNADLLGMVQQQNLKAQIDSQPIKVREALYKAYHFMNDTYEYQEQELTPIEIFTKMREGAWSDWDVKITWENYVTDNIFPILSEQPVASIPSFNNDFKGWIQATNWLIKTTSPDVTFGWQENIWSGNSANWVHNNYTEGEIHEKVAGPTSTLWNDLEVYTGEYKPDFLVFDKYERDGTSAAGIGYFFNNRDWDNYLTYVKLISQDLGNVPVMLWQIPGGHLQTVGGIDTRVDHGSSAPDYFFGDKDLMPDLSNVKPYLLNMTLADVYNSNSSTIGEYLQENNYDWSNTNNMQKAKNSNVFSILWGGGDTTSVGLYPFDDGGWLSNKVNEYHKNPTYLEGDPSDPPVACNDSVSTDYNTPITINVLSNDTFGSNMDLTITTAPSSGTSEVNDTNQIEYIPNTNFTGTDFFTYTITDENGSTTADVSITVKNNVTETYTITASLINSGGGSSYPEYVQPTGGHDVYMLGDKVTFNGNAFESVIDNNSWSPTVYPRGWKSISQGGDGSASGSISPNGDVTVNNGESQTFTITPDSNNRVKEVKVDGTSVGQLTSYTFTNITANHTISAEFEMGTPPVNNPPVANDDTAAVDAGKNIMIDVLTNDTDADGDALTITNVSQGAKGNVVLSNNSITYSADSNADGSDSFNYTVSDGKGDSSTALITVTINGTPGPTEVIANNDTLYTLVNDPITVDVLSNDTGDSISIDSVTAPANGTAVIENGKIKYTPNSDFEGSDSFNYTIIDEHSQTAIGAVAITVRQQSSSDNVIVGYWHNFNNGSTIMPLRDIPTEYNVVDVAFAEPASFTDMTMKFSVDPSIQTEASFKADIASLQAQGRKVLISIGGANGHIRLNTTADRDKFASSMIQIVEEYNFDGIDIDFEGGAFSIENSSSFKNPTSPLLVNAIDATKTIINHFKTKGKDFWLTAAPETYYLQTGISAYGGTAGSYIPFLYALKDDLNFVAPQLYNSGSMAGLDGKAYSVGTPDFTVAMTELLTNGFTVAGTGEVFKLRPDQVVVGLPSTPQAAGSGYQNTTNVIKALNYLTKGTSFGGNYQLESTTGYPDLRGIMTWSINWDKTNNYEFADTYYNYFFGSEPIPNQAPVANDDSAITNMNTALTVNVLSNDTDVNGDTLTITSVTSPQNGTVTHTATTIEYTPATDFVGTDSFNYSISDGQGETDTATVTVTVNNSVTPININPTVSFTALTDGQVINQKTPSSLNIEINSTDEDGTIASESITVEGETHTGSVYSWTPSSFGSFAILAAATDNKGATSEKTINITIEMQEVNTPPTVSFIEPTNYKTVLQETLSPLTIQINSDDADGNIASIAIDVDGQTFTESPVQWTPSKFADHQITVNVTDNEGATAIALITVTIQQGTSPDPSDKKQVVGYITQWDAWKSSTFGYPEQGVCNQLNVDYSKYTILNFSFFGVAKDGSLHSGDYRNKQMSGTNREADQDPADLLHGDAYSSWDYWILYGDLDLVQWVGENDTALQQRLADYGFSVEGTTWTNSITGLSGSFPVPLPKESGDPGLIKLCKQNNVKLMASLGGWSMSKHFYQMAADPVKKARFLADCEKLINMGFDGIDIDWEYPGPSDGMNFTGTQEDYSNFTLLMKDIRERIGEDKLITAAFSAAPAKLAGFEWDELDKYMNYYNMMTYDLGGGWSNVAEHNSPLYGAASWDNTFKYLTQTLNVKSDKINMGVAFYGRGVETTNTADLGVTTLKSQKAFSVDGTLSSSADFTNWGAFEGAPNYAYLLANTDDYWEYHWDSVAQVPYKVKGNYFLSYDNELSVDLKAQYVNDNDAGGVIIWQVFGDWDFSEATALGGTKLKKYSNVKTPLLDVLNNTFNK